MTSSIKDLRQKLGAYLTKPLAVSTGEMSTQQTLSATSLSAGGLVGNVQLGPQGSFTAGDKMLIGYQFNGF